MGGLLLFYRVFHSLTKFDSTISQTRTEPYYLMHKDSSHYALTFKIDKPGGRFGFYIGNKNDVSQNKIVNQVDTSKFYTILIDETKDSAIAVRQIILHGKTIYKGSQTINLLPGLLFILGAAGIFYKLKGRQNGG